MKTQTTQRDLSHLVKTKEARKLKEKQNSKHSMWFGLGMFGLVGWSVAVPTLLGTVLGIWLDKRFAGQQSWTLTLLLIGLIVGCLTAWHWLSKEHNEIHKDKEDNHE
ncbi:MAG: AtpZ/AtpI family protein [Bacteroidota bacterium]|nr:AtpZ/AtpI family protein [Bacteroidota bacterium]